MLPESLVEQQMWARLKHESSRMQAIESRMRDLVSVYYEFLDLRREAAERKRSIERLVAIMGSRDWNLASTLSELGATVARIGERQEVLRDAVPVWEAMKEYLSYVPEARLGELQAHFDRVGYPTNSGAMEAVLRKRPDEFRKRKSRHERFIALAE
jgi:hypothetical protein